MSIIDWRIIIRNGKKYLVHNPDRYQPCRHDMIMHMDYLDPPLWVELSSGIYILGACCQKSQDSNIVCPLHIHNKDYLEKCRTFDDKNASATATVDTNASATASTTATGDTNASANPLNLLFLAVFLMPIYWEYFSVN